MTKQNKIDNLLLIFLGGSGNSLLKKYSGKETLNSINIQNEGCQKDKDINILELKNNYENYLDGYYQLELKRFEDNRNLLIEVISKYKNILLIAGLGGSVGTAGIIFLSKLAKESNINCDAIVTKPFRFEGKRRIKYAKEAIEQAEVKEIISLDYDAFQERTRYRLKKGTDCRLSFNDLDSILIKYIDNYVVKYLNEQNDDIREYEKIIEEFLEEEKLKEN